MSIKAKVSMSDVKRLGALLKAGPEEEADGRKSAVILVVYPSDVGPVLLFTRRSLSLPVHQGQISFPGGAMEPVDRDLLDTAIREVHEEVGVNVRRDQVLGRLNPVSTRRSRFVIRPFLAILDDVPLATPNPAEVEAVLRIPLDDLLKEFDLQPTRKSPGDSAWPEFHWNGHLIWGATAKILDDLLARIQGLGSPP